jgi:hypothetical protein
VELGFLGGAVGRLGADQELLLLAWRFFTTGLGVALGAAFAARIYGIAALRRFAAGGRGAGARDA